MASPMSDIPRCQLTKRELQLLDEVIQPSGKTIRMLVDQSVDYSRLQARSAEVIGTNMTEYQRLTSALLDPRTAPGSPSVIGQPGAYGPASAPNIEGVKRALAEYDRHLEREPETFEDHFWRARWAVSASTILREYMINEPLSKIRGGKSAFTKHQTIMRDKMLKRELPEAHAQAVVYCNQAASEGYALPSRASAAAHPDLSTGGFQIEPFAIPPLIPRAEAETIVDDILALSKKRFKTLNFEFTDMAGLEDAPDQDDDVESWKVRSIDVDAMSYEVFFLEMGAPIPHSREELVDLLSKSWHA